MRVKLFIDCISANYAHKKDIMTFFSEPNGKIMP